MGKQTLPPREALYPLPVVLATCCGTAIDAKANIITIAWCGVVCSNPPIISISIRPSRYSHDIIMQAGDFAVNIPSSGILKKVDRCGIDSGKNTDKFQKFGFTQVRSDKIRAPLIKECPVNIECKLIDVVKLGSHDMFLGEVVGVLVDQEIVDKNGRIDFAKADPIIFNQGEYWRVGSKIGQYGYSAK